MKIENLTVMTPRGQKHPHLMVKKPDQLEWESIAILKVPVHEFWDNLGYGLNITFVNNEEG